ncbi:hypothetical protein P7D22_22355 [Lichenihabitans sp. Uapishka_5]|uniref:hypothetical protein n=1 Tax=Lichenihabitans sp. Uapishka_5 TaxID=3037302 RepID=UPI0029E7ED61|nr:hypothetical protein [Lichenihabitans sp. Uapishka_5]MDX7953901.1 hypothetical protein [Lichenihabitans sp. Uapishka_5]
MTMRFAGAALAAAVALTCTVASAESAEAAPFSIHIGAITGADGFANFTLTGDTTQRTGSFSYYENDQGSDFLSFISTNFTDPAASFVRSGYSSGPDGIGTTNSITFNVFDPKYPYTISSTDGSEQIVTGYSLAFTLSQRVGPEGTVYQYDTTLSSRTLLGSAFESDNSFAEVSGNPLSPVPIPASLPMMAIGLLGLGAFGCPSSGFLGQLAA